MLKTKVFLFITGLFIYVSASFSQTVYLDPDNKAIYEFLDEMANEKLITINSCIKPYTRLFIAQCLEEISLSSDKLNNRQKYELDFYRKDYNKELKPGTFEGKRFDVLYYKDSLFTFSLNGIAGGQLWKNENGINYHRWYGGEVFAYAGKHLGVYASLRDNSEKTRLADTGKISIRNGGKYRGSDYSEMRGGIVWNWNWGNIGLVKEHTEWGTSYRYPNIISSKAPSFAQLKLHLKPVRWFEFNYFHGWLVSEVVDSNRSYNYNGIQRNVFHSKYIAANMFTFTPWKRFNFSLGNSVVYSDQQINPAYFIPVFFYKSVDHTYNGNTNTAGQNSQMFLDISSRLIPHTHLYYSMFIDVLSFSTLFSKTENVNHWSMLGGIRVSDVIPNTSITLEYIHNNPLVYKNDNLTTLYNSNWYNLGHYLGDNAQEIYVQADYRPFRTCLIRAWYSFAQKGPDYPYIRKKEDVAGKPFIESVAWQQNQLGIRAQYQVLNDFFVFVEAQKQTLTGNYERYSSEYYKGNTLSWSFGMNFGFY